MVSIRQAKLADATAIAHFIGEAFGALAPFKGRERWLWQFVSNPFRTGTDDNVSVWIAESGGKVVGQMAVQPACLWAGDAEHEAGWVVDVMILPGFRGRSLGHRFHDAVAAEIPLLAILTMAPAMRHIVARAGCLTLAPVRQFVKLIHTTPETVRRYLLFRTAHHPFIRRLIRIGCKIFKAHWFIAVAVNTGLRFRVNNKRNPSQCIGIDIVEIDVFGSEVDLLWDRVRSEYSALFVRNSRFLNWRYVDSPDLHYRRFIARRGGRCIGYMVIRRSSSVELPVGIIVDFLASRADLRVIECLFTYAEVLFGGEVAALDCVTSLPEIERVLKAMGFRAARTARPTIVCRDPRLKIRIQGLKDPWHFTKGDQDWDQIRVA
jgi:Acetyltransferase (GNAT) domain